MDFSVHFQYGYTVRGVDLELPEDDDLIFDYDGDHALKVSLSASFSSKEQKPHPKREFVCLSEGVWNAPKDVYRVFQSLREGVLPTEVRDALEQKNHQTIWPRDHDYDEWRPEDASLSDFPDDFQEFVLACREELSDNAQRTVYALRWIYGAEGRHDPFFSGPSWADRWSLDGNSWERIPADITANMFAFSVPEVSSSVTEQVVQMVKEHGGEPVAHHLFREAWAQRLQNPRSALVTGIAAAEVGLKEAIIRLVPQTEWLITKLQSPDLTKLIGDYLPQLPAKCTFHGEVLKPPKQVRQKIARGRDLRNEIVHASAELPDLDELVEILLAIRDLLWLLDYYAGHEWAKKYLRPETLKALENTIH